MKYDVLINMDRASRYENTPPRPGALFCRTYTGDVEAGPPPVDLDMVAETLFMRHNRDDRPDGQRGPSLSVGDVLVIYAGGEPTAMRVLDAGFVQMVAGPTNITDREWRTVAAEENVKADAARDVYE